MKKRIRPNCPPLLCCLLVSAGAVLAIAQDSNSNRYPRDGLIAHWPLQGDGKDIVGENHATLHRVNFVRDSVAGSSKVVAQWDGHESFMEVAKPASLIGDETDFSIALWIQAPMAYDDLPGDILSHYDAQSQRGWQLSLKTNSGVTFNQSNQRHLQFHVDDHRMSDWMDRGRPGNALLAFGLVAHNGILFAGTCEPELGSRGHVYRFERPNRWVDCGSPDPSNAVTSMAVHAGSLFIGTGKYRVAGSALKESENPNLGGRIYRYDSDGRWIDCGSLPNAEAVGGMVEYRGKLYASSLYKPAGFFRWEGGTQWLDCGTPDGKRVEALGVFNGSLYASSYDGGHVYRFDGQAWEDCGQIGDNTQTYSFAVFDGRLHVGTWPSGRVYRMEASNRWLDLGRLGEELEVMGMMVHHGRLLAGTLPNAQIYQHETEGKWRLLKQLDATPEVKYRRAWAMAEFDGELFCSTLPSGRVFSVEIGKGVSWDHTFPDGWHSIVAMRRANELVLFMDGKQVAKKEIGNGSPISLNQNGPLWIGRGTNDVFSGRMSEVRIYRRSLTPAEIQSLAEMP